MPIIPYTIRRSIRKTIRGRVCWDYEYEHILVDVSDEVAEFLVEDNKREQRYQWKIKKQMQDVRVHTVISLDEIIKSNDSANSDFPVSDIIEDTVNSQNCNPLEIVIENEDEEKHKKKAAIIEDMCALLMTKKQYEVWRYHKEDYGISEIAKLLSIDESSVRERLQNAYTRITKLF